MTEGESDHERWQRQERRDHVPDNEVAASIPLDAVLGRTPSLAVVLLAIRVFSNGLELELMTRLRRVGEGPDSGLAHHRRGPVRADGLEDLMQLAVDYPDGRRAESSWSWEEEDDEQRPLLRRTEFSGTETTQDGRHWLTPLPPSGDVTIVFSWPYRGMPETRTVISAKALAQARAAAIELWPYEPEPE